MGTLGVGLDLVDVDRFAAMLARRSRLAGRLFTEVERAEAAERPERLAARFAAKEAALKSLGEGLGAAAWREIEVRRADSGQPYLVLEGEAARMAERHGVTRWRLSLSHTATTAAAVVVAEGD